MSTNWDYEQTASPYNDTKVDKLNTGLTGAIDELPALSIDISDSEIIKNLDARIEDSEGYWNATDGYDLKKVRGDNERLYLGKQQDVRSLYRFQLPYGENQIYIAEQAIIAYVTAQNPQPEVSPCHDEPKCNAFALDLEKVMMAHCQKVKFQDVLESTVRNALNKRVGLIYLKYDPNHGRNGEIIPISLDPNNVTIDKNVRKGHNPAFVSRQLKMPVSEACNRWPERKEDIFKEVGIVRGTPKQLDIELNIREVWLTHYDRKTYEPKEAVVYYFSDLVLEKDRNPNWLYANPRRNFMDLPLKPFIPLNLDNDGSHWIDQTSAVEQAGPLQNVFNKRGRQLMEVADKANGLLVVSSDSGLTKDDLQNLTGDPNQRIIIKTPAQGRTQDMVYQVPPPQVPNFLYQDKVDLRMQIGNIMGAPTDFTGVDDGENGEDTLGQSMMKKSQASGRQDLYVRAIDRMLYDYFNYLCQMMCVWYNDEHWFVYNGGDGEFDHIMMTRDLIEEGIAVNVKPGTSTPPDKQRVEAITLQLLKVKGVSLLDAFKFLHLPNPQQLYDNWAKSSSDPMALARDALDELDESKAFIAYIEIMNGKKPKDPDDCTKEFVLTLRKIMLRDEFIKAPRKYQKAFLAYVDKAIASLELRTSLDIMSREGLQLLEPQQPIQPLPPPMPPMPPQMPGMMPPGIMPGGGQPSPQPGIPPQNLPVGGGVPLPSMGGVPPIQNQTPMMNPANPVIPSPGNISAIPPM